MEEPGIRAEPPFWKVTKSCATEAPMAGLMMTTDVAPVMPGKLLAT